MFSELKVFSDDDNFIILVKFPESGENSRWRAPNKHERPGSLLYTHTW